MTGSTYTAEKWVDVQASKVAPSSQGTTASCVAGTTTNVDVVLTDDVFFYGLEFLTSGALFGDTVTVQVIDTNGITGAPAGTVLLTPVNNWNVRTDTQKTLTYEAVAPKKALATFTIRVIYNSTGISPVSVAVNYILQKLLQ